MIHFNLRMKPLLSLLLLLLKSSSLPLVSMATMVTLVNEEQFSASECQITFPITLCPRIIIIIMMVNV